MIVNADVPNSAMPSTQNADKRANATPPAHTHKNEEFTTQSSNIPNEIPIKPPKPAAHSALTSVDRSVASTRPCKSGNVGPIIDVQMPCRNNEYLNKQIRNAQL
jgi:hypothetical protein